MSDADEAERLAREEARQRREADLVANRIEELRENHIQGNFDAEHLKAVHAYIFQDLPHHRPGITRDDTASTWIKHRALEGQRAVYDVPYLSQGVETQLAEVLHDFGGPDAIKGASPDMAAERIAQLYGDLDHAHGFYEGNSRTLREFTRELATEAGFSLDWIKTGVSTKERNELYIARDLAVLERAWPGLTPEKADTTQDRAEYEAALVMRDLRQAVGDRHLSAIIREGLSPAPQQRTRVNDTLNRDRPMTGDEIRADPVRHTKQQAEQRARTPDSATPGQPARSSVGGNAPSEKKAELEASAAKRERLQGQLDNAGQQDREKEKDRDRPGGGGRGGRGR